MSYVSVVGAMQDSIGQRYSPLSQTALLKHWDAGLCLCMNTCGLTRSTANTIKNGTITVRLIHVAHVAATWEPTIAIHVGGARSYRYLSGRTG